MTAPNITIPVDLINPGQFFACCGLLELASRLWPGAEGWFEGDHFRITADGGSLQILLASLMRSTISNTMTAVQHSRLGELSAMTTKQRQAESAWEEEKKALEALHRELPIVVSGPISFQIDWFCDDLAGGSRFKTWAGRQSVFDISVAMHSGMSVIDFDSESTLWTSTRGSGLPFNFDSDLGGQGSALDIGFSFDPLAASETTRIEGACKPALEFLCFVGLQRFRPQELKGENRFVYAAWNEPFAPLVAAAVACQAIQPTPASSFEFRLLYRTKYLKSFLPAQVFQGASNE